MQFDRSYLVVILSLIVAFAGSASLYAESEKTPRAKIKNVRLAFDNGEHNAFTDLIRWKGKFWLAFRSCAEGHPPSTAGAVIVLSSSDAKEWTEVHRVSIPDRDSRGPHFLAFGGKLILFTASVAVAKDGDIPLSSMSPENYGCATFTVDGENWSAAEKLEGTTGYFMWGAAAHEGKAYLSGRRGRREPSQKKGGEFEIVGETALFESTDGLHWKITNTYHRDRGDETSFLFEADGELIGVTRRGGPYPARLLRSRPPYQDWIHKDFPFFIGGPLIKQWGNYHIVGGRRNSKEGKKTGIWWLVGDELKSLGILPSGGDNSYPGFAAIDEKHGVVSWYSSHEKDSEGKETTSIYVADLEILP